VLRWLEGTEPATSRVEEALPDAPVMSWMNVGEVSYVVQRVAGPQAAGDVVADLRARLRLDLVSPQRILAAAAIKADHAMAFADAFALATAAAHDATLLTGDPEILDVDGWPVEDLR
jgi:predicted nucleic acid-binding protein